jgi:hypothetical protein
MAATMASSSPRTSCSRRFTKHSRLRQARRPGIVRAMAAAGQESFSPLDLARGHTKL